MRRKTLGYLVRLVLSAGVLAVLAGRVDWRASGASLSSARPAWAIAAVALLALATLTRVWSFMLITNHRGTLLGFRQAAYLTLVGSAAALVIPGGAGDLFKAHVGGRSLGAPEHVTVAAVVDKLTSLSAVALMGALGGFATGLWFPAAASAALAAVSTTLVFVPRLIPWTLLTRVTALGGAPRPREIERAYRLPTGLLTAMLAVSLVGWLFSYLLVFAVAMMFSVHVSPGYLFAVAPLVTISTLLPISIAGIGVAQVTLVALLMRIGIDEQLAAQIALGQLALSLVPSIAGAVLYAAIGDRPWKRMERPRRSVAMLTTVYPRHPGDHLGSFVAGAAGAVSDAGWTVTAVAPHAKGLAVTQPDGDVAVERFRYLLACAERLAYGPRGIPGALKAQPSNVLALPFFVMALLRAARRASRRSAVLHAHWAPVGAIAAFAARRSTPLVLSLHGTDVALAARGGVWLRALRFACERAAYVLPVSTRLAVQVGDLVPSLPTERVRIIGNGVDGALFRRRTAESNRSGIIFVGRLTTEKGAFDAIRAHARVPGRARLTLLGPGDPAPLLELARSLGTADRVTVAGAVDHAEALDAIARAAVFVMPSHAEGFSVATLEAAALGTPVVATDVGAVADILGSRETLHAPGDTTAMAALVTRALEERRWAIALAASARESAAHFTWQSIGQALAATYDDALKGA